MHIIIAILSGIAGLIWALVALKNTGFRISDINPFLWFRRSKWSKEHALKPIYKLEDPIDVAAILLLGIAKCEGEITTQQKEAIKQIFEKEFHFTRNEAYDLLLASSHLMRDEIYLVDNLDKILQKSGHKFTSAQKESLLILMQQVANLEEEPNEEQNKLIEAVSQYFIKIEPKKDQHW